MVNSAKEDFIELMAENSKVYGFDELSSKLFGILFIESNEIALDELAKRTGYSLSAVSTAMKYVEITGIVKRLRKPKSRKVYFYMEKDMLGITPQMLRRKYENMILPSKTKLPKIIEQYKLEESKSKNSEEELEIVENYYRMILFSEQIVKEAIEKFEQYAMEDKEEGKKRR